MFGFHLFVLTSCASAALHHLYVGETDGAWIHALELDDKARKVTEMGMIPAGSSSSLALDRSHKYLFSGNPRDGTTTKYTVQNDYALKNEGSTAIPTSCNTTRFDALRLIPSSQAPYSIFGSASTVTCSTIFSVPVTGARTTRSREFAGDIRSLAWSPNGRHLHALDSHASKSPATSIFNFLIPEEPTLDDQKDTDVLANVTDAAQMVTHPTANLVYVVSKTTNELLTIPLEEHKGVNTTTIPKRFDILPSTIDGSLYTTSSLAISANKNSLWVLSQSNAQAIVTVFNLDASTGSVTGAVARAAWSGLGGIGAGQIAPAPFVEGDIVAVADSPAGIVAFIGLEQVPTSADLASESVVNIDGDDFLEEVWTLASSKGAAAARLKSYGRIDLGFGKLGEAVWVD